MPLPRVIKKKNAPKRKTAKKKGGLPKMSKIQERAFWGWWNTRESHFTKEDIEFLLEKVKEFNAGAVDQYLSEHVDRVYEKWLKERNG